MPDFFAFSFSIIPLFIKIPSDSKESNNSFLIRPSLSRDFVWRQGEWVEANERLELGAPRD